MRTKTFLSVPAISLLAVLFLVTSAVGKDGRDFAGTYNLSDVRENGDQIQGTLNLQLSNYSGQDLTQAVIEARSHVEPGVFSRSEPIDLWRKGEITSVSVPFKLQRREYERWVSNGQPTIFIVYRDPDGQTWERTAQLNSRPTEGF